VFPVGSYLKSEVRQLAAEAGLLNASKRSSRGICFVGKRRFDKFIAKYVPMNPGPFVDVETGRTVGKHIGLAAYTNGQRARISGSSHPWFVVGKRADGDVVFVAQGKDHPALYANTALATPLFWVAGGPAKEVGDGAKLQCQYKARYLQPTRECTVEVARKGQRSMRHDNEVGDEFQKSEYSQIEVPEIQGSVEGSDVLFVRFKEDERALTPRQALVLYDGDVCLGGGLLAHPGRTTFEKNDLELHDSQVQKVA
jgi:tRNA U34 2-thiouridine synthase MnmA/TrmU